MESSVSSVNRRLITWFAIGQARSKKAPDFGHGNMTTFKRVVDTLVNAGIKAVCLLPIHELPDWMASPFSRDSMNALSPRLLDLAEIPEIKNSPLHCGEVQMSVKSMTAKRKAARAEKTDIKTVEKFNREFLGKAFVDFTKRGSPERKKEFSDFCAKHGWWLDKYAYFKALQEVYKPLGITMDELRDEYADMNSGKAQQFINHPKTQERMDYYKFVQMETYRQVKEAFAYAHEKGIEEIEVMVGVGVGRESAEALLMRDIFDHTRQIGCFPEPKNGYPIQLWGFLAEKSGSAILDFKARCIENLRELGVDRVGIDHAAGALGGYTTFPVFTPDGSLRLLDATNVDDAKIAEEGGEWAIPPGQEEERLEFAKAILRAILERVPGMRLALETVGDEKRREAAEAAIMDAIRNGADITLMRALPWEEIPLDDYTLTDLLILTHDMPALTGLLTGLAGDHRYPWINGNFVKKFLNRLGILAPHLDGPITVSQLTTEFMLEIYQRITGGSNAGTVALPLATLFTLRPEHLDAGKWQYANIQPGTTGEINNPTGNWEQRPPAIEELENNSDQIGQLAAREPRYFDEPFELAPTTPKSRVLVQMGQVADCSVAYQAMNGQWTVWQAPAGIKPLMELAVTRKVNGEEAGHERGFEATFNLNELDPEKEKTYVFHDLVTGGEYRRTGEELNRLGLEVGLNKEENRHHFVIWEE
ncbi:MAG: 4-alpha-glucanotransferase, partial [Candidatus Margulisiibacteriota bacterium]